MLQTERPQGSPAQPGRVQICSSEAVTQRHSGAGGTYLRCWSIMDVHGLQGSEVSSVTGKIKPCSLPLPEIFSEDLGAAWLYPSSATYQLCDLGQIT